MADVLGGTHPTTTEVPPGAVPERAAGVELLGSIRGSGYRRPPCLVRRADGQTMQLTPLLYAVLDAVDGRRDLDGIARVVSERTGKLAERDDVAYLIDEKLRPLGVLQAADGAEPKLETVNPLLGLRFKFVISNPDVTRRVTRPFAALFHWWIAVPALVAFVATTWWVLFEKGLGAATHEAIYNPALLLLVFALTIVSGGFHEFGHAAACRYGGATPGAMGGAMYLVWPAFYTDVTDSYRLGRIGRLRVDLGGLYFNAIFAVATFCVWAAVGWDALLLVIPTQLAQMGKQLAPFIRADGYHIIADAIGVPDLFAHIKPTLMALLPTQWGRTDARQLKWWARALITVWVMVVIPMLALMGVFVVLTLPRIVTTAWDSAGNRLGMISAAWGNGDVASVLLGLLGLFAIALPALGAIYIGDRTVRRNVQRAWRKTEDGPIARAAVLALIAAVAAFVAWAWWPSGQYEPVSAHERGAVQDVIHRRAVSASTVRNIDNAAVTRFTTAMEDSAAAPSAERALALIPRDRASGAPTVLVPINGGTDEASSAYIVPSSPTTSPERTETREGWAFPFDPPRAPAEGDNQAVAVNTTDGATVYDVAFALVWVDDGAPVEHRNEAWALASCTECTTVSVAFQVVFTVERSELIVPVNSSVAANYECVSCSTYAIAVQLIATLESTPTGDVMARINEVWERTDALAADIEDLSIEQIYAELKSIEAELLTVLIEAGVPVETETTEVTDGAPGVAPDASSTSSTVVGTDEAPSSTTTTQPDGPATSEPPTTTSTTTTTSTSTTTTTTTSTTAPDEPTTSAP